MDVLERKLIKLKRLIQSVQSSKLVRSDNTHSLVKGIKRLTDNMSETVHQLSIPILQDGRLPEKENMEELNEFKQYEYLEKLEKIKINLKKISPMCKKLYRVIVDEVESIEDISREDLDPILDLGEEVEHFNSWIISELKLQKSSDISKDALDEIIGTYYKFEESISKKQADAIDSFRSRTEKEIDLSNEFTQKKISSLLEKTQQRSQLLNSLADENNAKVSELSKNIESIEAACITQIKLADDVYKAGIVKIEESKNEIESMLSNTANRVMADDYVSSAVAEKKAANWLRGGSLVCMTIIVGIVCLSFYDSTHSGFNWESSIFRTVLVFILSIPAAYLSRESTKHREQQYNYHHTALDLKAITPYIASLPEADQNRIKISIAERIFASRQTNVAQQESFPLNTQELIMELIKKIDLSKKKNEQLETENKKS